jgi:hypothetical protein
MINYPLTQAEQIVVRWTGRVITLLAFSAILLFGAIAMASS